MNFNKYYFENYPIDTPFDGNNPRYVLAQDGIDVILEKIVMSSPYSISKDYFENSTLVDALLHVEVLQEKNGKLGMAVPFFLKQDTTILKELSKNVASSIVNKLLEQKEKITEIIEKIDNGYACDRNLYHILCGYIFDGLMFDFLEENQLVTTSLVHDTGLDYLVIIYEDVDELNEYSDNLLCSYNRLVVNGKGFVSFGDSAGNRKDFYRYMRLKELDKLTEPERRIVNFKPEELVNNFVKILEKQHVEEQYIEAYEYFGYYKNGQIMVPIYDKNSYKVAEELYKYVLLITKNEIIDALSAIQKNGDLTAIRQGVEVKDIANEIYHLIFGEVNELLVQSGMVAKSLQIIGEGRYLKSFQW